MQKKIALPAIGTVSVLKAFTFVALFGVFAWHLAEAKGCKKGKEPCLATSLPSEAKKPKQRTKNAVLKAAQRGEPQGKQLAPVARAEEPKAAPAPAPVKAAPAAKASLSKLIPDLSDFDALQPSSELGDDPFPPMFTEAELSPDAGPGFPPPAATLAVSHASAEVPAPGRRNAESYYRDQMCAARWKGIANYRLSDGSRADCVNMEMAVRVAYADQWQEAIGQALHFGRKTGLRPAVALVMEQPQDRKFLRLLTDLRKFYGLEFRILVVEDR